MGRGLPRRVRVEHVAVSGHFVPEGIDWSRGNGFALTHDPFLLHFMHRWWAWVVVAILVFRGQGAEGAGRSAAFSAIHSAFGTQVILARLTVLFGNRGMARRASPATGALLAAATVWGAAVP